MNKNVLLGFLFLIMLSACLCACKNDNNQNKGLKKLTNLKEKKENKATKVAGLGTGSKLPAIDKSMRLSKSLDEISGLTYDASANVLIGHNDELGILYFIDFESGKLKSELKIGDIGDYEGVELVGDKIYMISSGGDLLEHVVGGKGSKKISTDLNANNNIEGLTLFNNQLLVACKGDPEMNSNQQFRGCRAIYAYSLSSSKISKFPFMLINYGMLEAAMKDKPSMQEAKRLNDFAPSGIAVHPKTKDIYVLSFKGGLLVVCNEQARIKNIYFLDEEDHRQPEGICFDGENRLYIANEGNGGTPVIHRYQF